MKRIGKLPMVLGLGLVALAACTREAEVPSRGPVTPLDLSVTGTISGKVLFEGEPPEPTRVRIAGDASCPEGTREVDVLIKDGRLANAFVYIREGLGDRVFELPKDVVVIDQQGCMYQPHVVGLQTGQELQFVNSDPTLHNVHTMPEHSGGVNFGMGVKGARRSIRIPKPEVMMTVKCDVHPWMRAYVGVLDHPYFAVTGEDGAFTFANVPPGDYVLEAWHERFGRKTVNVSVGEKASVEADFRYD